MIKIFMVIKLDDEVVERIEWSNNGLKIWSNYVDEYGIDRIKCFLEFELSIIQLK